MTSSNLRHSVSWVLFGTAGKQVLTFVIGVVLARLLTPADFGLLVIVNIFTGVLGFVATGGMGQALVRAKQISKDDGDTIFTIQLLTGVAVYLFFFATAPWIAAKYDNPVISDILQLSAISFIIRPFSNLPSSLLQRDMRFKAKALLGFVTLTASSVTSIVLALAGYGVWSLVWGGVVGATATSISHAIVAGWRPRLNFHFRGIGTHAKFGGLITLNNLMLYLRGQATNFIISLYQPAAFLGLYNKADSLRVMPVTIISGSIYQVSFRALAKVQDDVPEAQKLFLRALKLGLLYTTPVYIFLFFASDPLVGFVYGPRWAAAADALGVMALAGPLMLIGNQSGAVIEAFNRLKEEFIIQTWTLALIIVTQYLVLNHAPSLRNLALTIVGIAIVSVGRMVLLTKRVLGLTWATFYRAMTPVAVTNALLFTACYGFELGLGPLKADQPLLYLVAFSAALFCTYTLLVAVLPYKENKGELMHWVKKVTGPGRAKT